MDLNKDEIITIRPKKELQADHAWRLYNSQQEMIRFADYKIYLLYMIAGILMSIVFSQYKELMEMGISFKILYVLVLIASTFLIYYSMQTVIPRASKIRKMDSQRLIYFQEISIQDEKEYISRFIDLPTDQITEDLLLQVTVLSDILALKFENLKKAMWAFYVILAAIILIQVLKMFE
ncbi:MAG: Pycsar system effector family protein [Saprospiraceae bacterium]